MASSNSWTISDSNGMNHSISCKVKAFGGPEISVDTNTYRVKSSNWFVNLVDYSVDFPGANCHVVMIGNKSRLVVNGTYQDDGSQYEPVTSIPVWIWVLVAISVIGGWFFGGLLCAVIGAALSSVYISAALQKNTTKVIIAFVGFLVVVGIFFALNMALVGMV
ncbi:MAG: hypothetical protein HFI91_10850 [Lachnospiraceae bacterium]|nr:hypothetical protein [Lachnospiraceae bacterium]